MNPSNQHTGEEAGWTPGPWIEDEAGIVARDWGVVAIVCTPDDYLGYELEDMPAETQREHAANCRLIAAAPDLAEALEQLLAVAEMTTFSDQFPGQCEHARAALSRAKGGE